MSRLDHLVYATSDLAATRAEIERTWCVSLTTGGSHAGHGTANALISFGDGSYFELVGPDPSQGLEPTLFGIEQLTTPGLVAFAVTVTDIDASVAALRAVGHDPGDPVAMQRILPAGGTLAWRLTVPPSGGDGTTPFLIDWGSSAHPSTTLPGGVSLESFTIRHPEPSRVEALHRALDLDLPISEGPAGLHTVIRTPAGPMTL